MWAGQIDLREAIDLATCAAEDPATYLGAAINGLTCPTTNADLAIMVALTRIVGDELRTFIPITDSANPAPDAVIDEPVMGEREEAEAILEQTIIFH